MLGIYVSVPVACFRRGLAREFLETNPIPPPATCYGFLLSLVGETQRMRHVGTRVTPTLLNRPPTSVVLRTVWRLKDRNYWVDPIGNAHVVSTSKKAREKFERCVEQQGWPKPKYEIGLGCGSNARPDYQELLTGVELIIWLDSSGEQGGSPTLETRVCQALDVEARGNNVRHGGLSLGESTHLVNVVSLLTDDLSRRLVERFTAAGGAPRTYLRDETGLLGLPVWVDHVGSADTVYEVGNLVQPESLEPPPVERMPQIRIPAREARSLSRRKGQEPK
jgi:CRISPR-associated protein Cas5t